MPCRCMVNSLSIQYANSFAKNAATSSFVGMPPWAPKRWMERAAAALPYCNASAKLFYTIDDSCCKGTVEVSPAPVVSTGSTLKPDTVWISPLSA